MKFEAGKTYKVTFADGRVIFVKLIGGIPPKFHVIGDGYLVGTDWLNGFLSIEVVEDEHDNKEGGSDGNN